MLVNVYFSGSNISLYMYHSISEEPLNPEDADLSVRPEEFEKQLKFFKSRNMTSVTVSELGRELSRHGKYIAITFDDGYEDNYTQAFPLLKKYNTKATIFVITSLIGKEGYLTAEQIREMSQSGLVSIQSHTVSHSPLALGDKTREDVGYEFGVSKYILEKITGEKVDAVSMPNGSYDKVVIEIAKNYYNVICTASGMRAYSPEDISDAHRVGIYRHHTLSDVKAITDRRGAYVIKRFAEKLFGLAQ